MFLLSMSRLQIPDPGCLDLPTHRSRRSPVSGVSKPNLPFQMPGQARHVNEHFKKSSVKTVFLFFIWYDGSACRTLSTACGYFLIQGLLYSNHYPPQIPKSPLKSRAVAHLLFGNLSTRTVDKSVINKCNEDLPHPCCIFEIRALLPRHWLLHVQGKRLSQR